MLGWLVRISVTLLVVGLVAFDGVAVLVASLGVQDEAQRAARAASSAYVQSGSAASAYEAAEADLSNRSGITPGSFSVAKDGTVSLEVERTASTLFLHRTERTAGYAEASATATARSNS